MSILVMTQVFAKSFGGPQRKAVALKLADHADDEGNNVYPSLGRLAAACDVSESTARRVVRDFVAEGLLVLVEKGGQGQRSTNRYRFDLDRLAAMPKAGAAPQAGKEAAHEAGLAKGVTVTPLDDDDDDAKGVSGDGLGCQAEPFRLSSSDTRTIIEPSKEPSLSQRVGALPALTAGGHAPAASARAGLPGPEASSASSPAAGAPAAGERGDDRGLVEGGADAPDASSPGSAESDVKALERSFWELAKRFPGQKGMPTSRAFRAWCEMPAAARDLAVERLEAWQAQLKASGRKFWPSMFTYLAERLFEAVEPAAKAAAAPASLPAFGKGWMAQRMALLAGPRRQWRPTAFQRARKEQDWTAARHAAEFPAVAAMDEAARHMRPARPIAGFAMPGDLDGWARVGRGTPQWQAWADWHLLNDWPWVEPPEGVDWLHLPSEWPAFGPDGSSHGEMPAGGAGLTGPAGSSPAGARQEAARQEARSGEAATGTKREAEAKEAAE